MSLPTLDRELVQLFVPVLTLLTMSSGIAVTTEYQDAASGFVATD